MNISVACIGMILSAFAAAALAAPVVSASQNSPNVPVRFAPHDLGQDGRVSLTPAFAPDGQTLYFAQSECSPIWECPQRLKRSVRTAQGWSRPELLSLPGEGRVDWPSVTADGKTLLFSWATERTRHVGLNVDVDFDLYALNLVSPDAVPVPFDGSDINRIRGGALRKLRFVHNETAPNLTLAGDLYFWTERLDGLGERDVYRAASDGRGGFAKAEPLPPPINSSGRDNGAWIDPEGLTFLLTYDGRGGSGDDDLFVSHYQDGQWTDPVNLGPEGNSEHADFAARLTPDRQHLVFSSTRPVGKEPAGLIQVWTIPVASVPVLLDAEARRR